MGSGRGRDKASARSRGKITIHFNGREEFAVCVICWGSATRPQFDGSPVEGTRAA